SKSYYQNYLTKHGIHFPLPDSSHVISNRDNSETSSSAQVVTRNEFEDLLATLLGAEEEIDEQQDQEQEDEEEELADVEPASQSAEYESSSSTTAGRSARRTRAKRS